MSIDKPDKPEIKKKKGTKIRPKKIDINRPDISRLLTPAEIGKNPLADVDYGDGDIPNTDLREVAEAEEGAILKALKESEKADKSRFEVAVDTNFWFCVYFQSHDQKDEFLRAMGWMIYDPKYQGMYLNGLQLAEHQGIMLRNEVLQSKTRGAGRLVALAEDLGKIKIK
ncbi:MAG: hypothetical protein GY743_23585 [Planctomycetaceae bacterium]|nr:hypothetical protein [Planctomycetaceae bacterium]